MRTSIVDKPKRHIDRNMIPEEKEKNTTFSLILDRPLQKAFAK